MIEVRDLTRYYGKKQKTVKALDGVSFTLPDKGLIFVVGKSGSGKSTLLNLLCGLDDATSGSIFVNGTDICQLNPHELDNYRNYFVGIIYQHFNLFEEDTVKENIKIASQIAEHKVTDEDIKKAIEMVDIPDKENSLVRELSGGQKQRVAIARALIKNPKLVVADEPTGNLDDATSKFVFDMFKEISKEKLVVIVSHDMENAREYADRIIELSLGKVVSDNEKTDIYDPEIRNISLSSLAEVSSEELSEINEQIKDRKVRFAKAGEQFAPFEKEITSDGEKVSFKGHNMSWQNSLRLSLKFLSSTWISLIVAIVVSSMIIGLLALSSEMSSYGGADSMIEAAEKYDIKSVLLNKGAQSSDSSGEIEKEYTVKVTSDDILKFRDAGYSGNIYPVYATPVNNVDLERGILPASKHNFGTRITYGTMVTDMNYLEKLFGRVELLAGSLDNAEHSGGIIITDFTADGLLLKGSVKRNDGVSVISSDPGDIYQNLIGAEISSRFRIDAIIKTDCSEKYEHFEKLMKKYNEIGGEALNLDIYHSEITEKFFEDNINKYSMTFSLNPDFEEVYFTAGTCDMFTLRGMTAQSYPFSNNQYAVSSDELNGGEILVNSSLYSSLCGPETFDPASDTFIYLSQTINGETIGKTFRVKGVFRDSSAISIAFKMSPSDMSAFMKHAYPVYALCFDDISQMETILSVAGENCFYPASFVFTAVQNSDLVVNVFADIFSYISVLLIVISVVFIVFYNLRVIKNNQYRLGVYKSLGYSSTALSTSALLNSLYLIVAVFILSLIVAAVVTSVANNLLCSAFVEYSGYESFEKLEMVSFSMPLILKYVGITAALTVLSTSIPVLAIRHIKPNIIINKAE